MIFSVIIAIYNRQDELNELLESFVKQSILPNEVIIIDDGSTENLLPIIEKYKPNLPLFYYKKENSGPGLSRNFGAIKANGNYLLFLDSDCLVPINYIYQVKQ